jgi:prepilin-type N-terminal cleavage/methylation domain-containing protein
MNRRRFPPQPSPANQTRRMSRRLHLRPGVTLLELMVVVVIMGAVGAMSAGRVHALIIHQRITRAASAVQNNLEAAFAVSSRNRRPVRIAWDASTAQLQVTDRAGTKTYSHTNLGRDPYGLGASAISVSRSPVDVFPSGLANDELVVTITLENLIRRVRMSRAGMIDIQIIQ